VMDFYFNIIMKTYFTYRSNSSAQLWWWWHSFKYLSPVN
jgi:hypothetical protein